MERACALATEALSREDAAAARVSAAAAVRLARSSHDSSLEGIARLVYGRCLGYSGSLRAGLQQVDRAGHLLEGNARGWALVQRCALLYKMGKPVAALEAGREALGLLTDEADDHRARAFNNVGIVLLYLGRSDEARRALAEAERLHRQGGRPIPAAQSQANRAMAQAQLGDLIGALRSFDEAERELASHGLFEGGNLVAKTEVLLDAGLLRDVQRELPPVIAKLDATDMRVDAAEGMMNLALGLVGLGDPRAASVAGEARERFRRVGSPGWSAMAGLVEVRARWLDRDISDDAHNAARRVVTALARRRLRPYELDAQLLCAQLAGASGKVAEERRRLALVAGARHLGTVRQRAVGWEALARLRVTEGNRSGALRAADAGLRVIERHRDALGAVDLRAGASSQGVELAALGLRLALERRDPWTVLRWAERWRAGALYRRPLLPPSDPVVAELLAELRQTALTIRERAGAGRSAGELERRMAMQERALGNRVRTSALVAGPVDTCSGGIHDRDDVRAALGDRALIEYVESDGALVVVVLDAGTSAVHDLGGADEVGKLASATAFALRKLARLPIRSPAAQPALDSFSARLASLRASLLGPVLPHVAGRELVIVPTARLHAAPWSLLAGHPDRLIAVAPSAALWRRAEQSVRRPGATVAIAGPGLPGAVQEVAAICRHHPSITTLAGPDATVAAVNAAIDGAHLVHLAAHGDIRTDNPLFSSFRMVDGPQTVYDLQCLGSAPTTIVLSACNSAVSQVDAGEELLGLVASLLAAGTTTAIAAVLPVADLAAVPLMDRLHARLAAGDRPGAALAAAAAGAAPDDPAAVAAAAAFVCLGAA